MSAPLADEGVKRIDAACSVVIEAPGDFTAFEVDFAMSTADRLDRYGDQTLVSRKQWRVIAAIEKKIAEAKV